MSKSIFFPAGTAGWLLALLFAFSGLRSSAGTSLASLAGAYTNVNARTRDIVKIQLDITGSAVSVQAWGACEPTPCNWGTKPGIAYSGDVSQNVAANTDDISVVFPQGFGNVILIIRPDGADRIIVTNLTQFTDGSGRSNYSTTDTFEKARETALAAPELSGPRCGSVFDLYPRTTHLIWKPVSGATSYTVEIDCFDCCENGKWCTDIGKTYLVVPDIRTTSYTFDFVGAQPGRWRVWAIGRSNSEGVKSPWCEFRYTK
jgi:hypothetical protein